MLCEPEKGEYLDEEGEDADTDFTDKIMDMEKSSYRYIEENKDVDEKSIEDFKGCFAETNQHGRMEEKASVGDEVPYVFQTGHMCLIAGCTVGTEGQLLNIFQQFEESEGEGKTMDIWSVYVLHIYLLTLLQVLSKWIARMVDEEAKLLGGNQISFHWLK